MGFLREMVNEWRLRRAGRKYLTDDIRRSARGIIGPTGNGFSNAWDLLDTEGDKYLKSFDPRIPPSIHISQRDRTRLNIPIPLPERCLEDYGSPSRLAPPASDTETEPS